MYATDLVPMQTPPCLYKFTHIENYARKSQGHAKLHPYICPHKLQLLADLSHHFEEDNGQLYPITILLPVWLSFE